MNNRNAMGSWSYDPTLDRFDLSEPLREMLRLAEPVDLQSFYLKLGGAAEATLKDFADTFVSGGLHGTRYDVADAAPILKVELRYRAVGEVEEAGFHLQGKLFDVTQAAWMAAFLDARRRANERLLVGVGFFEWTATPLGYRHPSLEWLALTGQPLIEHAANWHECIVAQERGRILDEWLRSVETPGSVYAVTYCLKTMDGCELPYASTAVRTYDRQNKIVEWTGRAMRRRWEGSGAAVRLGPGEAAAAANAPELRAARVLLGWTLNDLAAAAYVSVSSVRRLEDGAPTVRLSVKLSVMKTLDRAGIVFLAHEGRIGVALRS